MLINKEVNYCLNSPDGAGSGPGGCNVVDVDCTAGILFYSFISETEYLIK